MPGPDQIFGHRSPHIAEPEKTDRRHHPASLTLQPKLVVRIGKREEISRDRGVVEGFDPVRLPTRRIVLVDENGPDPLGEIMTTGAAHRQAVFGPEHPDEIETAPEAEL